MVFRMSTTHIFLPCFTFVNYIDNSKSSCYYITSDSMITEYRRKNMTINTQQYLADKELCR